MASTSPLRLYRALSYLIAPLAFSRSKRKLIEGGVARDRIVERQGQATSPRTAGKLIWFHAASVGESLSIIPLTKALSGDFQILVTTGTASSARLLESRLPKGALHQFAPIDSPHAVQTFLDHWHPDAAVFVESEIWPNMILSVDKMGIPLALVNARFSERSLTRWSKLPSTARMLFGRFRLIVTQDTRTKKGLSRFLPDSDRIWKGGNMKRAAEPLPYDPSTLTTWRDQIGDRPTWVASSTHEGEDAAMLSAHKDVLAAHPTALLILAPRHAERGPDIQSQISAHGLSSTRLTAGEALTRDTQVLLADTMGDLGLWYRLAPLVFLAGSFGDAGGHNPWEASSLGVALLHGPNVPNASDDYAELARAGAALRVEDASGLGEAISSLLANEQARTRLQKAALDASGGAKALVERVAQDLRQLVERGHDG